MPPGNQVANASLVMSIGILVVVGLLLCWLWYDRRHRDDELSHADAVHFRHQDRRRLVVAVILGLVALGILVDSRLEPRINGRANPLFLLLWVGVFFLLGALPVLATFDWLATRRYARRQFQALARERVEILRDELRAQSYGRGRTDGPGESLGDPAAN